MEFQFLPMLVVATFAVAVLAWVSTHYQPVHARLLMVSLFAHGVAALGNLYLVLDVYGYGDLLMYQHFGAELALALRTDFLDVFPGMVMVFLQQENTLSVFVPAEGSEVATMVVLSALSNFLLSNSLTAVSFFWAIASFTGKLALLQAFFEAAPRRLHTAILVGVMLIPSAVFWSSGIIKEAVAVPALGMYLLGLVRLSRGRLEGLPLMALGALPVGLIKPYILLVAFGATGVYFYAKRSFSRGRLTIRPLALVVGAAVAVGGVMVIGEIFPRFSLARVAEEAARQQSAAINPMGGSTYVIGDGGARTVLGQLAFAPWALVTGLFRPFLFEANNPQMALNGLETAGFLGATVYLLWTRRLRSLLATILRHPILTFCLSFAVVFGIATGLTSANLGTLSRYRMPLVPFLAMTLVMLLWAEHGPVRDRGGPR